MPRTWIFQGNPDLFDLDGYVTAFAHIAWKVHQHRDEVHRGDAVLFWRAEGSGKETPAIFASGVVVSEPEEAPDDPVSQALWRSGSEGSEDAPRVWVDVRRVVKPAEGISRNALIKDPVCKDLLILKRPAGTNFPVTTLQSQRLHRLWARVGQVWSREESLAGLYAYALTFGGEVSIIEGSPVCRIALKIGRSTTAVYEKVMNFRSLDPRDDREGRRGINQIDADLWVEFYRPEGGVLDFEKLEARFLSVWGALDAAEEKPPATLGEAPLALGEPPVGSSAPGRRLGEVIAIIRDDAVTRWVKQLYENRCQACGVAVRGRDRSYAEGAHVRPLGAPHHGPDEASNVLCLCPNHHRAFDLGGFVVLEDLTLRDLGGNGLPPGRLLVKPPHRLDPRQLRYHRRWHEGEADE